MEPLSKTKTPIKKKKTVIDDEEDEAQHLPAPSNGPEQHFSTLESVIEFSG